jgi:hypothetical protein
MESTFFRIRMLTSLSTVGLLPALSFSKLDFRFQGSGVSARMADNRNKVGHRADLSRGGHGGPPTFCLVTSVSGHLSSAICHHNTDTWNPYDAVKSALDS